MIDKRTFEKEHIQSISTTKNKKIDAKLLEKMIRAFFLLEKLVENKIELTFKGGTSLLLLNEDFNRLSIDIDIITKTDKQDLEKVFPNIIQQGAFVNWEEDVRQKTSETAPVAHYKFYYQSAIDSNFGNEPVLLDVLFGNSPYSETLELRIEHRFLISSGDSLTVKTPSVDAVLGDKLTAFAPTTTGILYTKNRPVEMIKQLFDIAFLFDKASNLQTTKTSYIKVAEEEIRFRNLQISWTDVLTDTLNACKTITFRETDNTDFKILAKGISNIKNFIATNFSIEDAILCAAKTAWLCAAMKTININQFERYDKTTAINDLLISIFPYSKFNKLKKTNQEAFFYWYKAINILFPLIPNS